MATPGAPKAWRWLARFAVASALCVLALCVLASSAGPASEAAPSCAKRRAGLLVEEALRQAPEGAHLLQTRVEARVTASAGAAEGLPASPRRPAPQPALAPSPPGPGAVAPAAPVSGGEALLAYRQPSAEVVAPRVGQAVLSLAIIGALVYFGCGHAGRACLEFRSEDALARPGQRWRSQVWALTRKNISVSSRTQVPFCRWICNTCCAMIMMPILFTGLMTVLPEALLVANKVNMTDIDHHPKMYGRNYTSPDVWASKERALEDYLFAAPSAATMMSVPGSEYRMWPSGDGQPAGACYCRTLGLAGPGAERFQTYLEERYNDWRSDFQRRQGRGGPFDSRMQQKACPAKVKAPLFEVFPSEAAMQKRMEDVRYAVDVDPDRGNASTPGGHHDRLCGAVIFDSDAWSTSVPRVVVRTNVTGVDMTGSIATKSTTLSRDTDLSQQSRSFEWYTTSGFLAIQNLVEDFIVESRLGDAGAPRREVDFIPLPTDEFMVSTLEKSIEKQLAWPQSAGIMFVSLIMSVTYFLIRERNMRQKELMRLMGLYDSSLALSWLALFAGLNLISSAGAGLLIYCNLVERSAFFPLLLILWLCSMSTTALGMCVSAVFAQERLGAMCASGFYFVLGYSYLGLTAGDVYGSHSSMGQQQGGVDFTVDESVSASMMYLNSLVPQVGFALCLKTYLELDQNGGCTMASLFNSYGKYSIGMGFLTLLLSFFLYLALFMYLEQVMQHDVGVARAWYFPLQAGFWRELLGLPPRPAGRGAADDAVAAAASASGEEFDGTYFEEEESEQLRSLRAKQLVVSVRNLKKEFHDAAGVRIKAVDGLNLTMYQGECFCLLGHNGAGKSTTMAVLTGMLPQTSGDVEVLGLPLPERRDEVRKQMGFCMQQNVLWDTLTVEEHVHLFGALIGMSKAATATACEEVLRKVELLPKLRAQASDLSGGMKRKLNVALALLGSPRVLFLDEPSAGMDPHTRRQLWEMLKESRSERIVCLTTHYMDEADELGDRTCIMVAGRAACLGTNAFLKHKLGCGYMLNFVRAEESAKDDAIIALVRRFCGEKVTKASDVGRELRLRVPFTGAEHFPGLMKELDRRLGELRLESYGVGVSDLEDVFLKVASGESPENAATLTRQNSSGLSERGSIRGPAAAKAPDGGGAAATGLARVAADRSSTFPRQFAALFRRRVRYGLRDSRMFACQLVLPCFIMVMFLSVLRVSMKARLSLEYARVLLDTSGWNSGKGEYGPTSVSVGVVGDDAAGLALAAAWRQRAPGGVTDVAVNRSLPLSEYEAKAPSASSPDYREKLVEELAFADFATDSAHAAASPQLGGFLYSPSRVTIFPNTSSQWSAPALLSLHYNALIEEASATRPSQAAGGRPALKGINITSHPFSASTTERSLVDSLQGVFMGTILLGAFSFIPAGIAAFVAMEREMEVKHQLMVSGTGRLAYWASNLAFDCVFGLFSTAGSLVVFYFFGAEQWLSFPAIKATASLLLLFTPAVAANSYVLSFLFNSGGGALSGVLILNIMLGSCGIEISKMLIMIKDTRKAGNIMRWIVQALFPTACLGDGLMNIAMFKDLIHYVGLDPFAGFAFGTEERYAFLGDDLPSIVVAGDDIFMLMVDFVVYSVLVLVIDFFAEASLSHMFLGRRFGDRRCPDELRQPDDAVVAQESERVKPLGPGSKEVLVVDDVHKSYDGGTSWAVRGVSYALEGGQVFGLLGVNGAGKTTTFKMMCGQLEPSAGRILVGGRDVCQDLEAIRRSIGYCPQFNALLDLLTVREHLELYGQLKGLAGPQLEADLKDKLRTFELAKFEHSRAGQLSGGNMRKLSAAIAVVGEPPIIFLDEPSAGMDPVARRHMWTVIQGIAQRREHNLVVLTTHSMEEADALCSQIAIQASGQVRCLGTPQQLKEWHGSGLELNARLGAPPREALEARCAAWGGGPEESCDLGHADALVAGASAHFHGEITLGALAEWRLLDESADALTSFLREKCGASPGSEVACVERFGRTLSYRLSGNCPGGGPLRYGELFELLEGCRERLGLADFQLSQGTLERTFNRLAAEDLARAEGGAEA